MFYCCRSDSSCFEVCHLCYCHGPSQRLCFFWFFFHCTFSIPSGLTLLSFLVSLSLFSFLFCRNMSRLWSKPARNRPVKAVCRFMEKPGDHHHFLSIPGTFPWVFFACNCSFASLRSPCSEWRPCLFLSLVWGARFGFTVNFSCVHLMPMFIWCPLPQSAMVPKQRWQELQSCSNWMKAIDFIHAWRYYTGVEDALFRIHTVVRVFRTERCWVIILLCCHA